MTVNLGNRHFIMAGVLIVALIVGVWALTRDNRDPEWLRKEYGITNAFSQKIQTPDGTIDASLVPINLATGETAYLVVPKNGDDVYLKDGDGLAPVETTDRSVSREQFVRSQPVIVERPVSRARTAEPRATVEPKKKRSTQKEILIVAGSAGAGAAIGGIAGGKKGAAIGAVSGGVAGLVYDLATRNN